MLTLLWQFGQQFLNFDDYSKSVYGSLNGFGADVGINYQWKDENAANDAINKDKANKNKYKLNAGIALRNLGGMTFKDSNNESTNYVLEIQGAESLNLQSV